MQTATIAARRPKVRRLGPDKAHALVHCLELRCALLARLLGALAQESAELALVRAQLLVARLDRSEQLDDGLGDPFLERAVALPVELRLDLGDRPPAGDGHD